MEANSAQYNRLVKSFVVGKSMVFRLHNWPFPGVVLVDEVPFTIHISFRIGDVIWERYRRHCISKNDNLHLAISQQNDKPMSHAALSFVHGGLYPSYPDLTLSPTRINELSDSLLTKITKAPATTTAPASWTSHQVCSSSN